MEDKMAARGFGCATNYGWGGHSTYAYQLPVDTIQPLVSIGGQTCLWLIKHLVIHRGIRLLSVFALVLPQQKRQTNMSCPCSLPFLSADLLITPALRHWRNCVSSSTSAAQLSMCLTMLNNCIAWDKSIMKVVSSGTGTISFVGNFFMRKFSINLVWYFWESWPSCVGKPTRSCHSDNFHQLQQALFFI